MRRWRRPRSNSCSRGPLSPRQTIPKAEAAARKALELDETLAVAHRALGQILTFFHWKWDEGEKEFQRAAELSGGSDESVRSGEPVAHPEWTVRGSGCRGGTRARAGPAVVRRTGERGNRVPGGGAARPRDRGVPPRTRR